MQQLPPAMTPTARLVIMTVRSTSTPMSIDMIAAATGTPSTTVSNVTQQLVHEGHLVRTKVRRYSFSRSPVR